MLYQLYMYIYIRIKAFICIMAHYLAYSYNPWNIKHSNSNHLHFNHYFRYKFHHISQTSKAMDVNINQNFELPLFCRQQEPLMLSPTCSLKNSRHFAYLQHFILSISMPYKHMLQKFARSSISYYSNCIAPQIAHTLSCEFNIKKFT